jgi:3-methyl-2-oxobutanoate hydroxymethyltransferase
VAKEVSIPIIGIGAGPDVDGQVLVIHDMLGITQEFKPRFLRQYADLDAVMKKAFSQYISDVKTQAFPNKKESY